MSGTTLSDQCIRASWEVHRSDMTEWLIREKKFNPRAVPKIIDNFIASMVYAKLPNTSEAGIKAAANEYEKERP